MLTARYLVTCLACVTATAMVLVEGSPTPKVKFIVTVDGKSFFQEYEPFRNWTEASAYCKSMNMRLATITSQEQADGLMAASDEGFRGPFWTAGRDSMSYRQFNWDLTNDEVDNHMALIPFPVQQTCLAYHHPFDHMDARPCSEEIGTLCEI